MLIAAPMPCRPTREASWIQWATWQGQLFCGKSRLKAEGENRRNSACHKYLLRDKKHKIP